MFQGTFHLSKNSGLHFRKFWVTNGIWFSSIEEVYPKFRKFLAGNFHPKFSVEWFAFRNIFFQNAPCIWLPRLKFELTNQDSADSAGGKISSVLKGHLTPFCACATVWFLIRRKSFQSWYLWQKSFSIDLTRRLKIVILTLKDCLVIYERFKRHILCFELNTVENYAFLERGFSKRIETTTTFVP